MSIDQLRDVKLITALITPFHEDGSINYDALPEQLLKAQRLLMMRSWNSLRLFKRLSMVVCH